MPTLDELRRLLAEPEPKEPEASAEAAPRNCSACGSDGRMRPKVIVQGRKGLLCEECAKAYVGDLKVKRKVPAPAAAPTTLPDPTPGGWGAPPSGGWGHLTSTGREKWKISPDGKDALLRFGRHHGMALSQIVVRDPTYLEWLLKDSKFPRELLDVVARVYEAAYPGSYPSRTYAMRCDREARRAFVAALPAPAPAELPPTPPTPPTPPALPEPPAPVPHIPTRAELEALFEPIQKKPK